jgi:hypothetical protein
MHISSHKKVGDIWKIHRKKFIEINESDHHFKAKEREPNRKQFMYTIEMVNYTNLDAGGSIELSKRRNQARELLS